MFSLGWSFQNILLTHVNVATIGLRYTFPITQENQRTYPQKMDKIYTDHTL